MDQSIPQQVTQPQVVTSTDIYHQPATVYVPPGQGTSDTLGIASLILGIGGFCLIPLLAIPAVITGHMARSRTKSQMGLIGLILGYLGFLLYLTGFILYFGFMFWWW